MPTIASEYLHPIVTTRWSTTSIAVESGLLRAVTLIGAGDQHGLGGRQASHYYGQLFLASVDTPRPEPIILLASGYFGTYFALTWHGSIQSERSAIVRADVYGLEQMYISLRVLTEVS